MADNTFLKWNLSFQNEEYEKLYMLSKESFQKPTLNFVIFAVLFSCLSAWVINPFDLPLYEGYDLGYMITLLLLSGLFFLFSRKYRSQSISEVMVTILIIYFVIGVLESIKNMSAKHWGKLYYFTVGSILEFVLVTMILAKIGWIKNIFCFFIITFLVIYRYMPFEENFKSKFHPFIIQVQNFLLLSLVAFKLEKTERKIFFEMKKYESSLSCFKELITDFIPIPIVILNEAQTVFHNKEAEKLFKTEERELIHNKLMMMQLTISSSVQESFNCKYDHEPNLEEPSPILFSRGTTPLPTLLQDCKNFLKNNGNINGAPLVFLSITQESTGNSGLIYEVKFNRIFWEGKDCIMIIIEENKAMKKLHVIKEQDEYKNKLLATVSHDLRTPLYGVIGMIAASIKISKDNLITKNLNVALRSSNLLQLMINDIFDYTQITNGRLRLNLENFSLWNVIKDISKLFKFQAKIKGLDFIKDCRITKKQSFIKNHQNRLKQVLFNFLNNALKFTNQGFIKISLEKGAWPYEMKRKSRGNVFLIKIQDSGLGIQKDDLSNLFQVSEPIANSVFVDRNKCGVGLGLAINKRLLELLNDDPGGTHIQVDSEVGKGSVFSFMIKSKEVPDELIKEEDFLSEDNEFDSVDESPFFMNSLEVSKNKLPREIPMINVRVLLVDDDQINIMVGSSYLKNINVAHFDTAYNGVQALEKIKEDAKSGLFYNIIFMDCNMPLMDGLQATIEIKKLVAQDVIPEVRVIACTANASLEDREKCFHAGMFDLLVKPFAQKEMEDKITTI